MSKYSYPGKKWEDIKNELYTPEEIKITAQIAASIIKARSENNITQQKLADMSGVDRVIVSRIEKCKSGHRISTILKLLSSIGKTLTIVPIEN